MRGNTGLSALMRGAQAARDKQLAYNDQAASYAYDMSAKLPEDYKAYKDYLSKRASTTTDPSKQLTLQTKQDTAYRTHTSAEIGRASNDVRYGTISNTDKYAKIQQLQQQAYATGDMNLVNNLENQLGTLSITIQNEQQANAAAGVAAGKKAYNQGFTDQNHQLDQLQAELDKSLRTGQAPKNPDGSPVRLKVDANGKLVTDAQGNVIPDEKAPQLNLTSNNYSILKGNALEQKANLLQSYIDSGMDESGAKQTQLEQLTASKDYITHTDPNIRAALARGEDPLSYKVDDSTGIISTEPKKVVGKEPVMDQSGKQQVDTNGKPVFANIYETGAKPNAQTGKLAGQSYNYTRKTGTDANSANDDYTQSVLSGAKGEGRVDPITNRAVGIEGQDYIIDSITGKTIYLASTTNPVTGETTVQRSLSPLNKDGNASTKDDFGGSTADVHAQNRAALGNTISNGVGLLKKNPAAIGNLLGGSLGGIVGQGIQGIMNIGQAKQNMDAAKAKADAEMAALQAQNNQRNATLAQQTAAASASIKQPFIPSQTFPATPAARVAQQTYDTQKVQVGTNASQQAGLGPSIFAKPGGATPWWSL